MAQFIQTPAIIAAAGNPPKQIEEYVGRSGSGSDAISIARMVSPPGWEEPGQTPDFEEFTLVLRGTLKVETTERIFIVCAGQALFVKRGEWVRYSTPTDEGAEYVAVCRPAFSSGLVRRDE